MRALLGQIGGREIDGDALRGKRQADRGQRGVNPLPAFVHRLVWQADHQEFWQTRRDLDLHLDASRFEPQERHRGDMRDHFEWSPLPLAAILVTGDAAAVEGRAEWHCFQARRPSDHQERPLSQNCEFDEAFTPACDFRV
jgi:hypothetical protein